MTDMLGRRNKHAIDVVEALAGHRAGLLTLVDVREPGERSRAHVARSLHIPLAEIKSRLGEISPNRPVAFICQSGRRSAMAATAARRAGLDARNVDGGMEAWAARQLPIEKESA